MTVLFVRHVDPFDAFIRPVSGRSQIKREQDCTTDRIIMRWMNGKHRYAVVERTNNLRTRSSFFY